MFQFFLLFLLFKERLYTFGIIHGTHLVRTTFQILRNLFTFSKSACVHQFICIVSTTFLTIVNFNVHTKSRQILQPFIFVFTFVHGCHDSHFQIIFPYIFTFVTLCTFRLCTLVFTVPSSNSIPCSRTSSSVHCISVG